MNDQKGSKGLRNKRALALVLRGRQKVEEEQQREEWQAIQDHFESVSAGDIEMALEEFRNSEKREHRAQAGKLLVAYFLWCWRAQRDWVLRSGSVPKVSEVTPTSKPIATAGSTGARAAEGQSQDAKVQSAGTGTRRPTPFGAGRPGVALETYVSEFAKIMCERMASISADPDEVEDNHKLPKWRRPDSAFGWVKMPGRARFDSSWRARGIVACVELHARKGFPWSEAISKAAYAFDVKKRTVQEALRSLGSKKNKQAFKDEPLEVLDELFQDELSADKERRHSG
ncbi:MAG: hypothetical protein WCA32_00045 [Chromatiaceae bacterium]|jgi:hypothetical protein